MDRPSCTRAGTPLHPSTPNAGLDKFKRRLAFLRTDPGVDSPSAAKLAAVSTQPDAVVPLPLIERGSVEVAVVVQPNNKIDDAPPLIEEVVAPPQPTPPAEAQPHVDPPPVLQPLPPTMEEMVKDGVEVAGVGTVDKGDLLVPIGKPDSDAMYIPPTPAAAATPPPTPPSEQPSPPETEDIEMAIMRKMLGRLGADPATLASNARILEQLEKTRVRSSPVSVGDTPGTSGIRLLPAEDGLGGRGRGARPQVNIQRSLRSSRGQGSIPTAGSRLRPTPVVSTAPAAVAAAPQVVPIPNSQIVKPILNTDQPKPLAPVSAPTPQVDGGIEYWRGGGRLGNSSVTPNQVEPIKAVASDVHAQDIIHGVYNKIIGRVERSEVGEQSVTIKGVVSLPWKHGNAPMARIEASYPRTSRPSRTPDYTNIVWSQPVQNGVVDPAVIQEYLPDQRIDSRRVGSTMRGEENMSNIYAQATIPLLHQGHESYDLSGMFTVLHLMIDYSIFIDKRNLNRVRGAFNADSVTTVNILAEGEHGQAAAVATASAIETGRIPIQRRLLTNADLSVLYAISSGMQYIGVDAGNHPFLHRRFTWPRILWVLWDANPAALGNPAVVTTAQLRATASKLALWCDAYGDYVEGYIRAQTLINGKLVRGEDGTDSFVMSMLDVERVSLPFPRGRSFIWGMLTNKYTYVYPCEVLRAEFDILIDRTSDEIVLIGAVIASAVSLAASSVLNQFNVTGKNLNAWASHQPVPVNNFLSGLFSGRSGMHTHTFAMVVCNVIPQFLGFKISWTCFLGGQWCNGFAHRADIGDLQLWASEWGNHVPYMLRPEVLEWLMVKWLSVWGISGPGLSYDISNEVYVVGPDGTQGLMIWLGDDKYKEAALTRVPFINNPYGIFLINALKQDWRDAAAYVISYRRILRSVGASVLIDPEYLIDADWQPEYDLNTFTAVPGTLLSYDWTTAAVLGPVILRRDMADDVWARIGFHQVVQDSGAGYMSDVAPSHAMLNIQGYDFDQLFFGSRSATTHTAEPTAKENEEN